MGHHWWRCRRRCRWCRRARLEEEVVVLGRSLLNALLCISLPVILLMTKPLAGSAENPTPVTPSRRFTFFVSIPFCEPGRVLACNTQQPRNSPTTTRACSTLGARPAATYLLPILRSDLNLHFFYGSLSLPFVSRVLPRAGGVIPPSARPARRLGEKNDFSIYVGWRWSSQLLPLTHAGWGGTGVCWPVPALLFSSLLFLVSVLFVSDD